MGVDGKAEDRDRSATARDNQSEARDERAAVRDASADGRERWMHPPGDAAAADRSAARRDRQSSASDRAKASHDRDAAALDRSVAAGERASNLIDELTGAYRRDAGAMELEREIAVAKRTNRPFVLAFVDVDGLKATNDSAGHAAGDELLSGVVATLRRHTRSYDVIVRYGGDEFVCGLLDVGLDKASERFATVDEDIRTALGASISTGLAELRPHEGLVDLIERADDAMYRLREHREGGTPRARA